MLERILANILNFRKVFCSNKFNLVLNNILNERYNRKTSQVKPYTSFESYYDVNISDETKMILMNGIYSVEEVKE